MPDRELVELKELMYDTLTLEDDESDSTAIKAQQNMGVQLTNSMKKDGVTIVQMQNVVNKRLTTNLVRALKLIDRIQDVSTSTVIEHQEVHKIEIQGLKDLISFFITQAMPLKQFDLTMRKLYVDGLVESGRTIKQVAEVLECSPAHVSNMRKDGRELPETIINPQIEGP